MGGGNKKGGGGGGGQAPQVNIPAGIFQNAAAGTGLGQYASGLLDPLSSMTNWASSLATGGQAGNTQIPTFGSVATQPGPQASWGGGAGGSDLWNTQFNPQNGLVTFTSPRDPNQTFTVNIMSGGTSPAGSGQAGSWGGIDPNIIAQWRQDYQANLGNQGRASSANMTWASVAQQAGLSQADISEFQKSGKTPQDVAAQFNLPGAQAAQPSSSLTTQMGPILGQAYGEIQKQVGLEGTTADLTGQITKEGTDLLNQGESMLTEATTGTGLYPSQKAMIDEAVSSGKTELASKLGGMGLGSSTQISELGTEMDLAGAATGGQLVDSNIAAAQQQIALGQAAQKMALGGQALEESEQAAVVQELQSLQAGFWTEAMQGYGLLGNIIDEAGKSYGLSLSAYNDALGAEEANAANQAGLQEAQLKADTASSNSMMGALGSLFGQGGSGSNLLGGLFGAGGGAAAGGAAAIGLGSAGGSISSGIGAVALLAAA